MSMPRYLWCKIELIEKYLQSTDKQILERLSQSLGPQGLKSKEGQAAIKLLEGQLSSYTAQMDQNGSHKAIRDFEKVLSSSVFRLSVDDGMEAFSDNVCDLCFSLRGGLIGWLPAREPMELPVSTAAAVGDEGNEESTINPRRTRSRPQSAAAAKASARLAEEAIAATAAAAAAATDPLELLSDKNKKKLEQRAEKVILFSCVHAI